MKKRESDATLLIDTERQDGSKLRVENINPWPHVFNLINCIVGVSVLAMPYCFQQCGILLAVLMIAAGSVITKYTCHFLYVSAYLTKTRSFEDLTGYAFGYKARKGIEILMLAYLMSSIIAFIVVIGDIGPHIVAEYLEMAAPTERLRILFLVLVMIFVIFPLSRMKDIESFSAISSLAVLFYGFFVLRMMLESLQSFSSGTWSVHVVWWRPQGFLACLPIITMALSCQTQLFHVVVMDGTPLLSPNQVDSVLSLTINLCSAMYAAVGVFGYVAFYDRSLHGDVLVELMPTFLTQLLKLLFMLSIAISIPLMLFPARHALFNLCLRKILMLAYLMSSIIAFIVVIGDIGPHIVAEYLEMAAPTERLRILFLVLVMIFVIFPLSRMKDIESFSAISSLAVLFYGFFVLRMMLESLQSFSSGTWSVHVVWWRPQGFLACLPIITMALSCQTQLFHVVVMDGTPLLSPNQVDSVLSLTINLCSAMYAAVGVFGYVAFYDRSLHGDVLVELMPTFLTQLLKLLFMLSIAISIPLMLFPARHALFNLCLRKEGCELPLSKIKESTFNILTAIILLGDLLVAIVTPNVEFILGLTGSLIGSLVTIIVPSLIFMIVAKSALSLPKNMARICLLTGLFILVMSTVATLQSERKSKMASKPVPKTMSEQEPEEREQKALNDLERLEERVLDANLNISQKLSAFSSLAEKGIDVEAKKLLDEMKQQQEEQAKLMQQQEQIVDELNKHKQKKEDIEKEKGEKAEKERFEQKRERTEKEEEAAEKQRVEEKAEGEEKERVQRDVVAEEKTESEKQEEVRTEKDIGVKEERGTQKEEKLFRPVNVIKADEN